MEIKNQFAKKLMEIEAIKLQPNDPFTWASGWKSPIYTDNRKTLSYPSLRSFVKLELCHAIQENFPEAEAVAGVATGAIAQGALVADQLGLPYSYVRPKPKDHGMGNQVEGEIKKGAKVVVVEDLISTGGSSLKAVKALRDYGVEVIGRGGRRETHHAEQLRGRHRGGCQDGLYQGRRQGRARRMAQEPGNVETVVLFIVDSL